jgi:hypothetical protein
MRGGTSKAIFFHEKELPSDPKLRNEVVLDVFGSPDIREIDGLGGADGSTSKLAIISRYNGSEADVEYNFGHMMFDEPLLSYSMNCGNISAAVGPFAVDEGLIKAGEPITTVRVFNINSQKVLIIHILVKNVNHSLAQVLDAWIIAEKAKGSVDSLYRYWMLGEEPRSVKTPRWSVIRDVLHWVQ